MRHALHLRGHEHGDEDAVVLAQDSDASGGDDSIDDCLGFGLQLAEPLLEGKREIPDRDLIEVPFGPNIVNRRLERFAFCRTPRVAASCRRRSSAEGTAERNGERPPRLGLADSVDDKRRVVSEDIPQYSSFNEELLQLPCLRLLEKDRTCVALANLRVDRKTR